MDGLAVALSTFLLIWVTLLVAASVVMSTGGRVLPAAKLPADPSTLSPYELAYLSAGPARTTETVLVALLARGVLERAGDHQLRPGPAGAEKAIDDPLEAAAVRCVVDDQSGPGGAVAVGSVRRCLAAGDAMADLRRQLRTRRLLMRRFGHAVAVVRLYGTLVLSVACLCVPPVLLAIAWRRYDPDPVAFPPEAPPGFGVVFLPFAVLVGIGGLQAYRRCGHLLRAGLARRTRNTVATVRARRATSSGIGDGQSAPGSSDDLERLVDVALKGPDATVHGSAVVPDERKPLPSCDLEYNGGVLRFVGRGSGRSRSGSSGGQTAE